MLAGRTQAAAGGARRAVCPFQLDLDVGEKVASALEERRTAGILVARIGRECNQVGERGLARAARPDHRNEAVVQVELVWREPRCIQQAYLADHITVASRLVRQLADVNPAS